jgi:hypothetical protein
MAPVLSRGPTITKPGPPPWKECRSSSTSCSDSSGHSQLATWSSNSRGVAVGINRRLRLRSPLRSPFWKASGLLMGTRVSVPQSSAISPRSSASMRRRMAMPPQTSLPCTVPSTSSRGPGRGETY